MVRDERINNINEHITGMEQTEDAVKEAEEGQRMIWDMLNGYKPMFRYKRHF